MLAVAEGIRRFSHYTHERPKAARRLITVGLAAFVGVAVAVNWYLDQLNAINAEAIRIMSSQRVDSTLPPTFSPQEPPLPRVPTFEEKLGDYLQTYEAKLQESNTELKGKVFINFPPFNHIKLKVVAKPGITERYYPDEKVGGKTGRSFDYPYDARTQFIEGAYTHFVLNYKKDGRLMIWAVKRNLENPQEPTFFCVFDGKDWLTEFWGEEGKINPRELFGPRFSPHEDLPKIPGKVL